MFEFLNTVAKENPEIAAFLLVFIGLAYFIYYIVKSTREDNKILQATISRQHTEALGMGDKMTDAHIENTTILTELKTIIQTINK